MKRTLMTLCLIIVSIALLSACGQTGPASAESKEVQVDGGFYRDITPEQLRSMLENEDFLLVNVHIPYGGELPDTDLFIPYNEIEQNLSQLPADKESKIVLYCRSGSMSATAARTLVGLGFNNIWNLDGGFVKWEREGYELIQK